MVEPSRTCSSCRAPVSADAGFCSACGAPMPAQITGHVAGDVERRLSSALADRYRFIRELGRGGMAIVYLAHDVRHERNVAIKVLRPELAQAIGGERFIREIKLAAKLNHQHILSLHDSGEADGFLYYVMPFVEGESLRDRLQREGPLTIEDALQVTKEVAEGLDYAHEQGVIHRDIKPENILLSRGHALIADFGIAKAVASARGTNLTSTGTSMGTPLYMSPEQAAGDPQVDGRTDVYSLGCVLYEMLAGEPPFTAPTAQALLAKHAIDPRPSVRTVRDTVPDAVDQAIRRAMAKAPVDRLARPGQLAQAIGGARLAASREARSSVTPSVDQLRLRPSFLGGIVGGVLGGAAAGLSIGIRYVMALDPAWGLDVSGKIRLASLILVFAVLSGAVLGVSTQLGFERLAHLLAYLLGRAAPSIAAESTGSVLGGLAGGALLGIVFVLVFATRWLPPPDVRVFLPSVSLIPLMLVVGIFTFDYAGRLWHVVPPLIGAVLLTATVAGVAVVAFPYDWFFRTFFDQPQVSVTLGIGGLLFGAAIGSLVGVQVGMTLLLDRWWRRIGPASLNIPPAGSPSPWHRAGLVAAVGAGCFVVLSVATGIPAGQVERALVETDEGASQTFLEHYAYARAGQYLAARGMICDAIGIDQRVPWLGDTSLAGPARQPVPLECRLTRHRSVVDFDAAVDSLERVLHDHGRQPTTMRAIPVGTGRAARGVAADRSGDSTLHFAIRLRHDTLTLAMLDRSIMLTDTIAAAYARALGVGRQDVLSPVPWAVAWRVASVPDTQVSLSVRLPLREMLAAHFQMHPIRRFIFEDAAGGDRVMGAFESIPWEQAIHELAATYGLLFDERVPGSGIVHVARLRVVERGVGLARNDP